MKLQTATRLALYAVLELAEQPERQLSRLDIAEKFRVSSNHLSKVLRELVRAGLVEAVRGVGGGYRFVGNARRTTLLDIIRLFETFPFDADHARTSDADTDVARTLDLVMDEINETVYSTLDSITISTMLMLKDRTTQATRRNRA